MRVPVFHPIVLGHNSFFGVNHLSAARGQETANAFHDPTKIIEMIRYCMEYGAGGMMMSTHERAVQVCDLLRNEPVIASDLIIYPLLPYAQKYVKQANEKGLINIVTDTLSAHGAVDGAKMLLQGATGVLRKDALKILSSLMKFELGCFKGLRVGAVFLHDIFTDLILALDLKDIAEFYCEEIPKIFNAKPAFTTKNLPTLLLKFSEWGLEAPCVMSHFNKIGFSMSPDQAANEQAVQQYPCHVMAMSTLASGFLTPKAAFPYLAKFENIESIVVGVSSRKHVPETFGEIQKLFAERQPSTASSGTRSVRTADEAPTRI